MNGLFSIASGILPNKGKANVSFSYATIVSVLGIKPNQKIKRRLWEEGVKSAAIAA